MKIILILFLFFSVKSLNVFAQELNGRYCCKTPFGTSKLIFKNNKVKLISRLKKNIPSGMKRKQKDIFHYQLISNKIVFSKDTFEIQYSNKLILLDDMKFRRYKLFSALIKKQKF